MNAIISAITNPIISTIMTYSTIMITLMVIFTTLILLQLNKINKKMECKCGKN
jgi:hypothetical protein